jgi:hypothetical protein
VAPAGLRRLLSRQLERPAAAAVWLGIALGIIPIYGLQAVVALALATLLGLNRPLTLAALSTTRCCSRSSWWSRQLGHPTRGLVSLAGGRSPARGQASWPVQGLVLSAIVGGAALARRLPPAHRRSAARVPAP